MTDEGRREQVHLKVDTTTDHATSVRSVRLQADPWKLALCVVMCTLLPALQPPVDAQLRADTTPDNRFAGLQWRFVRIKYHYDASLLRAQGNDVFGEPWGIDSPAAEQNLSRRIKTATALITYAPLRRSAAGANPVRGRTPERFRVRRAPGASLRHVFPP